MLRKFWSGRLTCDPTSRTGASKWFVRHYSNVSRGKRQKDGSEEAIPGIRCLKPKGTFYVFPNVEGVCRNLGIMEAFETLPEEIRRKSSPSTLLQMFLLFVHGVATMDRKSFGRIGAEPFHYLRLSIATGTEELKKGVERIAAGAADRAGFRRFFAAGEHNLLATVEKFLCRLFKACPVLDKGYPDARLPTS